MSNLNMPLLSVATHGTASAMAAQRHPWQAYG